MGSRKGEGREEMKCKNCNHEIREGARFCAECGFPVELEESKEEVEFLFCNQCGRKMAKGQKKCAYCSGQGEEEILTEGGEEKKEKKPIKINPVKPKKKKTEYIVIRGLTVGIIVVVGMIVLLLCMNFLGKDRTGNNTDDNANSSKTEAPDTTENTGKKTTQDITGTTRSTEKIDVQFENIYENSREHAVITAKLPDGNVLWTVETESYEAAQLDNCVSIGQNGDGYYYVEAGIVVKLDLETGKEVWKCTDVNVGSPTQTATAFGDDGTIYVSGYLEPEFVEIDKNGKLVYQIQKFSEDSQYFWPYKMEYRSSYIKIYFEGNLDEDKDTVVQLNLDDYSYATEDESGQTDINSSTTVSATGESGQEITLEGVDSSNQPNYDNCVSLSDYQKIVIKEGEFSFGYPKNFFNKVEKEGDNYTFTSKGGKATLIVKHEKGSGDKVADVEKAYKFLEGKIDMEDEKNAQKKVADKEKNGWTRCIYTGLYIDDPNQSVYFIGVSNGEDVYTVDFEYSDPDVDDFYTPQNYMIDCLYRLCDHSGADYEARTYQQFLKDDLGTKK